jgi:hypothetical protein
MVYEDLGKYHGIRKIAGDYSRWSEYFKEESSPLYLKKRASSIE